MIIIGEGRCSAIHIVRIQKELASQLENRNYPMINLDEKEIPRDHIVLNRYVCSHQARRVDRNAAHQLTTSC